MLVEKSEYTYLEIATFLKITVDGVRHRSKVLNLPSRHRTYKGKVGERYFFYDEVLKIISKTSMSTRAKNIDIIPEIIYITRTTFIYESRLNFLKLEQL